MSSSPTSATKSATTSFLLPEAPISSTDASNETPRAVKQSQYVFRVLNQRRATSSYPESSLPATEQPSPSTSSTARALRLQEIRQQLKKSTTSTPTHPSPQKHTQESEQEVSRISEENGQLREKVAALAAENGQLRRRNEVLQAAEGRNAQLQQEIQRIKNEYVQTSLDCFQEFLRPHMEQAIALKSLLETQTALRESLQSSLSESHSHNQYLNGQLKTKAEIFQLELRSQQQRFEVALSDRENQIQNLRNALATLQQRYNILTTEVKAKDEFLLRIGHAKQ